MAKFNNRKLPDLVWESPNGVEGRTVDEFLILNRYAFYWHYARKHTKDGYKLCAYDTDNFFDVSLSHRFKADTTVPHLIHENDCYIFDRNGNWAVIDKDCLPRVPKSIHISIHGVHNFRSGAVLTLYTMLGIKVGSCEFHFKDGDNTNLRRSNLTVIGDLNYNGIHRVSGDLYKVLVRFDRITKITYFDSASKALEYRNQLESNILYKGVPTVDWYAKE